MPQVNLDAIIVFASAFVLSASAGLASLLRSSDKLTWKAAFASIFNSGILGLGISLLWYTKFRDNVYFLVGICVIAGLGGMAIVDFAVETIKKVFATKVESALLDKKVEEGKKDA